MEDLFISIIGFVFMLFIVNSMIYCLFDIDIVGIFVNFIKRIINNDQD